MTERIKCINCDNMILPVTAERTGGLCGPCNSSAPRATDSPLEIEKRGKHTDQFRKLLLAEVAEFFDEDKERDAKLIEALLQEFDGRADIGTFHGVEQFIIEADRLDDAFKTYGCLGALLTCFKYKVDVLRKRSGKYRFSSLQVELLDGRKTINAGKTKIGGSPDWIQDWDWPACPGCDENMTFLMQLDSLGQLKANKGLLPEEHYAFGDVGLIYMFWCPDCYQTATRFQCH